MSTPSARSCGQSRSSPSLVACARTFAPARRSPPREKCRARACRVPASQPTRASGVGADPPYRGLRPIAPAGVVALLLLSPSLCGGVDVVPRCTCADARLLRLTPSCFVFLPKGHRMPHGRESRALSCVAAPRPCAQTSAQAARRSAGFMDQHPARWLTGGADHADSPGRARAAPSWERRRPHRGAGHGRGRLCWLQAERQGVRGAWCAGYAARHVAGRAAGHAAGHGMGWAWAMAWPMASAWRRPLAPRARPWRQLGHGVGDPTMALHERAPQRLPCCGAARGTA